jgi:two-component system, NarL family, nitrate/nitrite response regulator NarL
MVSGNGDGSGHFIRVLIAADVRLYREGLAASLSGRRNLKIVGTAANRVEARTLADQLSPDVVVLDMATRESLDLIRELHTQDRDLKILAFAVDEVSSEVLECAEAGAAGYVSSDASIDELACAIDRISRRELVCSPRIAASLFCRIAERVGPGPTILPQNRVLTSREREVLELICHGQSNKDIARELHIAEPTVKNHVHNLLEKLEVTNRGQAAARATLPRFRRRWVAAASHSGS